MGDTNSEFIFSIDPGIVNVGVVCLNYKTDRIHFANKLTIAPSLKSLTNEAEIIPRVYKLFFDPVSPYRTMINESRVVLIEIQMKRKFLLIQNIIGAFCFAFNLDYEFVSPKSIKGYFGTGKYSRLKKGIRVKDNHKANKVEAVLKAMELFPTHMSKIQISKRDDVADALLQAYWYGKTKFLAEPKKATQRQVRKRSLKKPKESSKKRQKKT